jgi:hypothetical protein
MNAHDSNPKPRWWERIVSAVLGRVWFLHPPHVMIVALSRGAALQVLGTAAKPSTTRLHLRNVFAQGRRYGVYWLGDNRFQLMTTSKVAWHYRRRTNPTSVMFGTLTPIDAQTTRLELTSHIRLFYLLEFLLLPTFVSSLIVSMPWGAPTVLGLVLALYSLSWFAHRYTAALEAQEMVFFVEKAFEEYLPRLSAPLAEGGNLVYDAPNGRGFERAWQNFYEQVMKED